VNDLPSGHDIENRPCEIKSPEEIGFNGVDPIVTRYFASGTNWPERTSAVHEHVKAAEIFTHKSDFGVHIRAITNIELAFENPIVVPFLPSSGFDSARPMRERQPRSLVIEPFRQR
jgi:hypothetical protein